MNRHRLLLVYVCLVAFLLSWDTVLAGYTLDRSFGEQGRAGDLVWSYGARANDVVVQSDGRIIVAGSASSSADHDFSLLRLLADGRPDPSFNEDGRVTTAVGRQDDEALAVGLLSDGRIVAGGYSFNGTDRDFALACYLDDGSLDRSFGQEGVVVLPIGNSHDEVTALAIGPDDRIVVAGVADGTNGRVMVAAAFLRDGSSDLGFGEQGVALFGIGADAIAQGVLIQEGGRIVLSGSYRDGETTSRVLVGLQADGSLETDFGVEGLTPAATAFAFSEGYGLTQDAAGTLYLAGAAGLEGQRDPVLFRFSSQGEVDHSFSQGGYLLFQGGPEDDVLYDVQATGGTTLVASGYSTREGVRRLFVVSLELNDQPSGVDNDPQPAASAAGLARQDAPVSVSPLSVLESSRAGAAGTIQVQELKSRASFQDYLGKGALLHREQDGLGRLEDLASASWWSLGSGKGVRAHLGCLLEQLSSFLVPTVVAAELPDSQSQAPEEQVVELAGKEAVGNGLAVLPDGRVVVVGTQTDGHAVDSMAVVRLQSEQQLSRDASADGQTSRFISTKPITEITRTGALSGGEILVGLSGVTKRGVVFSIAPDPVFKEASGGSDSGSGLSVTITSPVDNAEVTTLTPSLTVTTSEKATCGYNQGTDVGFASTTKFPDGLATSHSAQLSGLTDDQSYTYFVRCQTADQEETVDSVTFTIKLATSAAVLERVLNGAGSFLVASAHATNGTTSSTNGTSTDTSNQGLFGSSTEDDFVEEGHTEDGSGIGRYSSILKKLKPGTTYHVRAYAQVGSTVFYGNQQVFRTADACFIATAAYGTLIHPCVRLLRDFRDAFLLKSSLGQELVELYYSLSPPLAEQIANSRLLRLLVSLLLLPLVGFSWLALQLGLVSAVVSLGTGFFILGMVRSRMAA
ncbi:delta-60 repeat domain-containing protein [Desulfogranum mediterraneum]|uniref:delta-60 repeat domain-containing protein n=1 Tax=Desulfogranum mediterraneum TaxID=160661 RepID=UPI0004155583|nr:delta-60 repeat domain-containing protein [Desulfogranum mediterraneum]